MSVCKVCRGKKRVIVPNLNVWATCPECYPHPCPQCKGRRFLPNELGLLSNCPMCQGKGKIPNMK